MSQDCLILSPVPCLVCLILCVSHVSCPMSPVSCLMSRVSHTLCVPFLMSHVSFFHVSCVSYLVCLVSHVSCVSYLVCLMSRVPCLLSRVSHTLCVPCLVSRVSCLMCLIPCVSHVSCPMSRVSCLMSRVSHTLYVSCLMSRVSHVSYLLMMMFNAEQSKAKLTDVGLGYKSACMLLLCCYPPLLIYLAPKADDHYTVTWRVGG